MSSRSALTHTFPLCIFTFATVFYHVKRTDVTLSPGLPMSLGRTTANHWHCVHSFGPAGYIFWATGLPLGEVWWGNRQHPFWINLVQGGMVRSHNSL